MAETKRKSKRAKSIKKDKKLNFNFSIQGADIFFLAIVLALTAYGLVMVYSASAPSAFYVHNDSTHFFKSQALWSLVGIGAMLFVASVDFQLIKKFALPIYGISMLLLVAVLAIGKTYNGAKRWLDLGFTTFQPSEIAKIAVVIMCAVVLSKIDYIDVKETMPNLLSVGIIFGIYAVLLIFQPHLSAIIIVAGTLGVMMLVAGIPLRVFTPIAALGVAAIAVLSIVSPYRMERMMSFTDPFKYKMDEGYQAVQSLYAIGSGGFSGLGLGRSRQKYLYIPEPQNDFIYSIICEELGFLGAMLVIVLFVMLLWRAVKIAMTAPDRFSMILVCGLISLTIVQVILNIGVATSSIPPTGIPLPFFSAGGTSFVFQMISMGIILNISKQTKITIE